MKARWLIGWRVAIALACAVPATTPCARGAGVDDGTIQAIDKMVAADLEKKESASFAVGVVQDGHLVLAKGYGFADLENDVPATAETIYRLGSITKQFTSMAIMQLAEQGKLSVDDELTKFLPDYPAGDHKFTVHQLLNHTSGIKSYTGLKDFRKVARHDFTHDELLALFKDEPLDFEPGTQWKYNNSGYYLLGVIIEKASGQSYAEYLQQHIFAPLGMSSTRYGHQQPIIRHRASGYVQRDGELVNDDFLGMDAPGAAGALVSNVLDLIKWHQALESGQLISPESYEALYRPTKLADGKTQPYGYGWGIGTLGEHCKLSHGGGINGFSTVIARYPDERLAIIVLANTAGANVGDLEQRIARRMLGVETEPVLDLAVDAKLLEQLVGTYELAELTVEVTSADGALHAKPTGLPIDRLKYQGQRRFVSSRNDGIRVTFTPAEGRAAAFELEMEGRTETATRKDKQ